MTGRRENESTSVSRKLKEILLLFCLKQKAKSSANSEKESGRMRFENSEDLNSCQFRFLWDAFLFVLKLFHYPFSFYYIPIYSF